MQYMNIIKSSVWICKGSD